MRSSIQNLPRPAIAASLLAADFAHLADEIARVEEAGANLLHIDVMDGHFVPNLGIGVATVEKIRLVTDLPLNVHLMVERPDRFLDIFARAGADYLTFHRETTCEAERLVEKIHEFGCGAGVASNPESDARDLLGVLPMADLVLVMTVHPGFGGQRFFSKVLEKVRVLRSWLRAEQRLAVDGGIDRRTGPQSLEAGADLLVSGTAIFHALSYFEAIRAMVTGPGWLDMVHRDPQGYNQHTKQ